MRSIRGYVKNLIDGLGPPVGSVEVHPRMGGTTSTTDLNLTTDKVGKLVYAHLPASGSETVADPQGRFGWDMELAPAAIYTSVNPSEPQPEKRWRLPDESAQIGKAYHSDLERLGWAGGRDHLIWNAVFGGNNPTTGWSADPTQSGTMGNGSIDLSTAAANPGRVTIRKFIAMLGGVPFTVEMGDLLVPVTGDDPIPANANASERWDVLCAAIDWNPLSPTYGKQRFEFVPGAPGGGVPPLPTLGADNWRRLPLHALRMAGNASIYSAVMDMRVWANPPAGVSPGIIAQSNQIYSTQTLSAGNNQGLLNQALVQTEFVLPLSTAWTGVAYLEFQYVLGATGTLLYAVVSTEGRVNPADPAIVGTNYAEAALNEAGNRYPRVSGGFPNNLLDAGHVSLTFPLHRIPAFTAAGAGPSATSRTWTKLRFTVQFFSSVAGARIADQRLYQHLWPVV